ncbi:MAG: hypothetical protein KAT13_03685, partial [Methanosarcinales archaeon]|nr:hypothetical protein [Methanosarcinales archaeon]
MNRQIITLVALVACMFVACAALATSATSAAPAGAETETIDIRGEVVDAAFQIAPFTWTGQNFAGLHYDVDRNILSEALTTTVTVPDLIDRRDLVYTSYRVESNYANHEIGEYFEIWWFGEKYMAINGKPYMISPVIMEMDKYDKKTLATGEEWYLRNGYSLIAEQIDLDANEVRLTLNKDGDEVYSSVIRLYDQGDWFNNCMDISGSLGAYAVTTEDIQTERTFVYQTDVDSEADVPVFSVYVDAIFRGTTTNLIQLKCAMLIDDDLVSVIDEGAGILDVRTVTSESVRLESEGGISLDPDLDFHIAEGLWLRVAGDLDGDGACNYRYYPYISHECPEPEPTLTPTPTPTPTPIPGVGAVEIRGEVVEPTTMQTPIVVSWNTSNFAAFWYDFDEDVATESLMLAIDAGLEYDRTIDANHLAYKTTAVDVDFDYSGWGSYQRIGFLTEECFAGYGDGTDDVITDEPISLVSSEILSKVLIDKDARHTLSTGASLQLEEDYELKITQLDINGDKVQIELNKGGEIVDSGIVDAPDTFVYKKDLGSVDDVPTIVIHVGSVFAGTETNMAVINGIFQISENCIPVQAGDEYGEMEVTSTSDNRITMENYESLALRAGKTTSLMTDIKLVVADNETLRFAPVRVLTEPGTYEVRGAVVRQPGENQSAEIVWNASNSAFLWYDIDSDASSETLTIAPGTLAGYNRTIYEDALSYGTHPVYQEYELHENEGLTVEGDTGYMAEGWMGTRYVAAGGRADRLCELLLEFEDDDKKTLLVGEGWDLGGGFMLTPMQIDLEGDKVWFTLNKDGRELDSTVVSSKEVCTCAVDIGDVDDVPIFSCYVIAVFRGTDSNIVQVKYVFLINDDPLEIAAGDRFERMRVVTASSEEVVLKNDVIISLEPGITEKVMDEMYFRTAEDSTLRFYPFMERTIHGASGGGGGGTYPPGWNATPPAGGDDDSVIFDDDL